MEDVDLFREKVFSVAEISQLVHDVLEGTFQRVSVQGEITSFKRAASGHSYFSLTERDSRGGTLRLDCAIFKWARLAREVDLKDGKKVVASGKISSWGGSSRYQLIVDSIRESGAGDLLQKLEELKRKLALEGLFEQERKRPLPFMPRRVGVVTSLQGAAVRDIVRTILNLFPARILIRPALVQGRKAACEIVRGIEELNLVPDVDVIIVGRGGGSMEDLWAFNEEELVRAVAASRVPVVSAVGHEVDHLLTDDAADERAATPTAAGQLVVPSLEVLRGDLTAVGERLSGALERAAENAGQRLDQVAARLDSACRRISSEPEHRLQMISTRLHARNPRRMLDEERRRHDQVALRLRTLGTRLFEPARNALESMELRLKPLNPFAPLDRGYALARTADGDVISRFDQVSRGDAIDLMLNKGGLDCVVEGGREKR